MHRTARPLTIVFATETGNAASLAEFAEATAKDMGLPARLVDAATYNTSQMAEERGLLVITSTHEGHPPYNAIDFFDFLEDAARSLQMLSFAVLALGDSAYDDYCAAGERADRVLEARGAHRLLPRCEVDVGERNLARDWIADALARFVATGDERPAAVDHAKSPVPAPCRQV
jgi:sulfite reductase (NADPH) flavoprotein alpha-component